MKAIIEGSAKTVREELFGAVYPAFASEKGTAERDVYALYCRTKKWKCIYYLKDVLKRDNKKLRIQAIACDYPTRKRGEFDLYDLVEDRFERNDLSALGEHKERIETFKKKMLDWWTKTGGKALP